MSTKLVRPIKAQPRLVTAVLLGGLLWFVLPGRQATRLLVAWDAGSSGRTELFSEYKAQRRSRPDLLKQQWPAMEPLVESFGVPFFRAG